MGLHAQTHANPDIGTEAGRMTGGCPFSFCTEEARGGAPKFSVAQILSTDSR